MSSARGRREQSLTSRLPVRRARPVPREAPASSGATERRASRERKAYRVLQGREPKVLAACKAELERKVLAACKARLEQEVKERLVGKAEPDRKVARAGKERRERVARGLLGLRAELEDKALPEAKALPEDKALPEAKVQQAAKGELGGRELRAARVRKASREPQARRGARVPKADRGQPEQERKAGLVLKEPLEPKERELPTKGRLGGRGPRVHRAAPALKELRVDRERPVLELRDQQALKAAQVLREGREPQERGHREGPGHKAQPELRALAL